MLLHWHLKKHHCAELVRNSRADPAGSVSCCYSTGIGSLDLLLRDNKLQNCGRGRSSLCSELTAEAGFMLHLLASFFSFVGWGGGRGETKQRGGEVKEDPSNHESPGPDTYLANSMNLITAEAIAAVKQHETVCLSSNSAG